MHQVSQMHDYKPWHIGMLKADEAVQTSAMCCIYATGACRWNALLLDGHDALALRSFRKCCVIRFPGMVYGVCCTYQHSADDGHARPTLDTTETHLDRLETTGHGAFTLRSLGSGGISSSESEPLSMVSAACLALSALLAPALLTSGSTFAAPRLPKQRCRTMVA